MPVVPAHAVAVRPRGDRHGRLLGAALVLATVAAYSNSFQAPFVYDDVLAIPQNPTIRKLWPLADVLWPQADGGLTVSGRPVLNLSFALNHAVSGTAVWSYHVFNILVHAGAALLLFGIVRRSMPLSRRVSIAGRGIFAGPGDPAPSMRQTPPAHRLEAGATALSFAVAGLWALHPLHTRAVTYTVQRAESLAGFFYLLTLHAFIRALIRQQ